MGAEVADQGLAAIQTAIEQCQLDLNAICEALETSPDDADLLGAREQLQESLAALRAAQIAEAPAACLLPQQAAKQDGPAGGLHPLRINVSGNNARIHPRGKYAAREPDFAALAEEHPYLQPFLRKGRQRPTLNFGDRDACVALTRALLASDYGVKWSLPAGHLVPALTGRANYLHWLEDLLALSCPPGARAGGAAVRGLDVGTGANLIYPLLGAAGRGWSFVGVDVVPAALQAATDLLQANPHLAPLIELRLVSSQPEQRHLVLGEQPTKAGAVDEQEKTETGDDEHRLKMVDGDRFGAEVLESTSTTFSTHNGILSTALRDDDLPFAFSMCNPPFFGAVEEAGLNPRTAYGGTPAEMVFPGGEAAFVRGMACDSACMRDRVHWFSTMVGKKATLRALRATLRTLAVPVVRTTELCQGTTSRWAVAWSWQAAPQAAVAVLPRGSLLAHTGNAGASGDATQANDAAANAVRPPDTNIMILETPESRVSSKLPTGLQRRYMTELAATKPATLLRRLEAAAADAGVASLHVNAQHYLLTAHLPLPGEQGTEEGFTTTLCGMAREAGQRGEGGTPHDAGSAKRFRGPDSSPGYGGAGLGTGNSHKRAEVSLQVFQARSGVTGIEATLLGRGTESLVMFRAFVQHIWTLVHQG